MLPKLFLLLLETAILLGGGALVYLWSRFRRFEWLNKLPRRANLFYAAIPAAALFFWWITSLNGLVVILHLAVIWMLCDLAAAIVFRKSGKRYVAGYAALTITFFYLLYGYIACHQVTKTDYILTAGKPLGRERVRIALIADAHLGEIFGGEQMASHLRRIAAEKPDILVITGDLVDSATRFRDVERMCEALAEFPAPLGKYFAFGNHDKGYRNNRDFSETALVDILERSGVRVLRDEAVDLNENITLLGRRDRSERGRRRIEELLQDIPRGRYRIVLNHQPTDYVAEAASGADLVLSGHTHGGQLLPLAWIMRQTSNDNIYGYTRRDNTDFIITSGIADWAVDFKTGCRSEFVIIDVVNKPAAN